MKRIIILSLFITQFFCNVYTASAQKMQSQQSSFQLRIDNNIIGIDNVSTTDAIGADNKILHTASFNIELSSTDACKAIIATLQSFSKEKKEKQLYISTLTIGSEVSEDRVYSNITVQEIIIPALIASSASPLKVTVKIKAATLQIQKGNGLKGVNMVMQKRTFALSSNFSFAMGSLPCKSVSMVSSMSIKPGDSQFMNITIDVAGTDATAWNQWFLTGAGGIKKEQGSINLLAQNLVNTLYTIQLSDVEIVSFSTINNPQNKTKATVGLRVRKVAIL